MITSGDGKYKVFLEEKKLDDGIIYILGGGEKSHIGGVVICEPGKKPIAETACKKYKTKVVALGGVHVDNASKEEIGILVENCNNLIKHI